jgi:hypothetical protein
VQLVLNMHVMLEPATLTGVRGAAGNAQVSIAAAVVSSILFIAPFQFRFVNAIQLDCDATISTALLMYMEDCPKLEWWIGWIA